MKKLVRFCAFALLFATLFSLSGCGQSAVALSYGDSVVTANMYRYWLCSYKGTFLYTYTDMTDTDAFWDSILYEDITAEDYLNASVLENVKRTLLCMELFDQYGLTLPDYAVEGVDQYISELMDAYADGSKVKFNQTLSQYGVNMDMLRQIYLEEEKPARVFAYLYDDGGPNTLTEEDLDAYYRENYVRVRHIYVNDAYEYVTNEAGYQQYDSNGTALMRELNETEAAAKAEKIAAIEKALAEGQDFKTVYETYSEDLYYVNGYYLTRETDFITDVVDAAFGMEIGETVKVESEFGTHWLMRLPLEDNAYNESTNADFFDGYKDTVANADFMEFLDGLLDDVTVNEEEIEKYSIRDAAVNYSI